MGETLNPLVLALIGAPTLVGFYFRVTRWHWHAFRINLIASCLVMAAVAIGYGFMTIARPTPFFASHSQEIVVVLIGAALGSAIYLSARRSNIEAVLAIPFALIVYWLAATAFCALVPAAYAMPLAALALFCGFAVVNAALGPLAIGLSASATLHALFAYGSLDYVFIWTTVFELFEISHAGIKLMIIGTTCLAGSGDVLEWAAQKILATDG